MTLQFASPPPLDAEPVAAPDIVAPRPPQDWETLVTPGHVLRERVQVGARKQGILAGIAGVVAAFFGFGGPSVVGLHIPESWVVQLQVHPMNYAMGADGFPLPYRAYYLADLPAQPGMTNGEFVRVINAVGRDFRDHGTDPTNWTETTALPKPLRITRPAKVFEEGKLDALSSGVVAIAADQDKRQAFNDRTGNFGPAPVTAHLWTYVDGILSWVRFTRQPGGGASCFAFLGPNPVIDGKTICADRIGRSGNPAEFIANNGTMNDEIEQFNPNPPPKPEPDSRDPRNVTLPSTPPAAKE